MTRSLPTWPRLRGGFSVLLACAASAAVGAFYGAGGLRIFAARADSVRPAARRGAGGRHQGPDPGGLHCPLAFAGVHLLKDMPEWPQVAYHFCKPVNEDLNQCVLYDGTGPDARLIGDRVPRQRRRLSEDAGRGEGLLARPQARG